MQEIKEIPSNYRERLYELQVLIDNMLKYNDSASARQIVKEMKGNQYEIKKEAVLQVHENVITRYTEKKNGKMVTKFRTWYSPKSCLIRCSTYEAVIEKLFDLYYPEGTKRDYSLSEVYEEYETYRRNILRIRETTINRERIDWEFIKKGPLADMPIRTIRLRDLKNYLMSIAPDLRYKSFVNKKGLLNRLFQYAYSEMEIIPQDICSSYKCTRYNGYHFKPDQTRKGTAYSEEEREKILQYFDSLPVLSGYQAAAYLMFCLGCRVGEVKALKWSDIVWSEQPKIDISKQIVRDISRKEDKNISCVRELSETKAKSEDGSRYVPLSERAQRLLKRLKVNSKSEYICVTLAGNPLSTTGRVNDALKEACENVGIEYKSSHKIRSYAIVEMDRVGFSRIDIARLAGHTDYATQDIYKKRAADGEYDFEKIENIFG